MERLLLMDEQNYDSSLPEIKRTAVRGIVWHNGKMLFVRSMYGEVKLPGGGQEDGETDLDTLVREVREETGYEVIRESARPFGYIEEIRLSTREPMIWHQFSRLYFCEVTGEQGQTEYSEGEKKLGIRFVTMTLDEAIENNRHMLDHEGERAWNRREYNTLILIRDHYNDVKE
ncbi:MAG: NUDIX domain-containing protein [Ruminococcus sp.]|nr:NUDIX domain-containing protein [Ruminococcus sp.]